MVRVTGVPSSRRRRKRFLKMAKGYRGGRSRLYRTARESVQKGLAYAFRDRKVKKRNFRQLWIARINAKCTSLGLSYSKFIGGLKAADVAIDRKMLADLAVGDEKAFKELVKIAKAPTK